MLKAKDKRKGIKLLEAKKTTYVEVNTPSTPSPVTQKLSQEQKMLRKWDQCKS